MENSIIPNETISNKIYFIRNQKVMIDRDLAELFAIPTKRLNEQVKRNINRFTNHFMFQLTEFEKNELVANCDHLKNLKFSKSLPYAFSEHGILMLSNVLNSERAITFSIKIIEVFIEMREYLIQNLSLKNEIEEIRKKLNNHDKNIELVFNYLDELMEKQENTEPRKKIGYK
ncbi:MAG: DNA-binding protein [Flavobacteriales bacterium]|nr:MAG: DNA-binding protein [Flavobacteriales bacterium]